MIEIIKLLSRHYLLEVVIFVTEVGIELTKTNSHYAVRGKLGFKFSHMGRVAAPWVCFQARELSAEHAAELEVSRAFASRRVFLQLRGGYGPETKGRKAALSAGVWQVTVRTSHGFAISEV